MASAIAAATYNAGHKSTVTKIREERQRKKKLERARSKDELAALNHQMNLDADAWPSPIKEYLHFAGFCDTFANSNGFGNFILGCIMVAGALVGIQSYSKYEEDPILIAIDNFILYAFTLEVLVKIVGEGLAPWTYFTGRNGNWNMFDFTIVFLSWPILPFAAGQIKLLRLIRLMRLAKAFRKVPQLAMIMQGLGEGMDSIMYILVLMLLVFYLYACAGILFFRDNDPFHFMSIEVSMLTLLGVATLDGWGEIMFVNYFGCDVYGSDFYTNDMEEHVSQTGGVTYCDKPSAQPIVSALYFISFIVIASFCILSLFIGAVASGMIESMNDLKKSSEEAEKRKVEEARAEIINSLENRVNLERKALRRLRLIELAFQGQDLILIEDEKFVGHHTGTYWVRKYRELAYFMQDIAESQWFQNLITGVILMAGIAVGMGTDRRAATEYADVLIVVDVMIQWIFVVEIVVKIISEEFRPWNYFKDAWNVFDFFVVLGSFVMQSNASLITLLRLLRLLRVLKLLRAFPQLQVIVSALMKGLTAIGFISVMLLIFFYFFGIIFMTFFGANDKWHFGSLHMSMITLFQCSTMDNWSAIMWISLYGCDVQDGDNPHLCTSPQPQFALATFFFIILMLTGAFVLLTLFIGVVGLCMEESEREQKKEAEIEHRAFAIGEYEKLDQVTVRLYKEVFQALDLISSLRIGSEEMKFGLTLAGLEIDEEEFNEVWSKVDRDETGDIDFAEFLEFMCDLRHNLVAMAAGEDGSTINLGADEYQGDFDRLTDDDSVGKIKGEVHNSNEVSRRGFKFLKKNKDLLLSSKSHTDEVHTLHTLTDLEEGVEDQHAFDRYLQREKKIVEEQNQAEENKKKELQEAVKIAVEKEEFMKSRKRGEGSDTGMATGSEDALDTQQQSTDAAVDAAALEEEKKRAKKERKKDKKKAKEEAAAAKTKEQAPGSSDNVETPTKDKDGGAPSPDSDTNTRSETINNKKTPEKQAIPPMQKQGRSPTGERFNYTVIRAQSSFQKVPFDADLLGNDGGSPETTAGSPMNRISPYRTTKKAVKSLVVSI